MKINFIAPFHHKPHRAKSLVAKFIAFALLSFVMTIVLNIGVCSESSAELLKIETGTTKLEGVTLASSATIQNEGQSIKLSSIGAGLRNKKVVFVNVRVYVGELLAANPEKFQKSESDALGSVKNQSAIAMQLHFLRNVDAENVQKSFKEALKANNINQDDESIKQFLEKVIQGGEAKEGKALTILGIKHKDNSEEILYETTSGTVSSIKGAAGFIEKVFSIWLGKPADDGVAHLKKSLLKN